MLSDKNIYDYILKLKDEELRFKNGINNNVDLAIKKKFKFYFDATLFIARSFCDFILLKFLLCFKHYRRKKIVYTAQNFTIKSEAGFDDRILKPLFKENILYINQSKSIYMDRINNNRVYNVGGVVRFLAVLNLRRSTKIKYFKEYQIVNRIILRQFKNKEIYLMWFYDLNSLSIIFSSFRSRLKIIEVQHGSIINYPPYIRTPPIKLIDTFYVKNTGTIDFLKEHLCKGYECDYYLIPYPKTTKIKLKRNKILYASTPDFAGFHPVFLNFLSDLKNTNNSDFDIEVRLHPRERTKEIEDFFSLQMSEFGFHIKFDFSKNWIEEKGAENLIIISPWSSTIEDAFDNGYTSIVIDPAGKNRFKHLIDNSNCFYSDNIFETIKKIGEK